MRLWIILIFSISGLNQVGLADSTISPAGISHCWKELEQPAIQYGRYNNSSDFEQKISNIENQFKGALLA